MNNERYNGWSNRGTWNIALWLNNDEGLYRAAIELRNRLAKNGIAIKTAQTAKKIVLELMGETTPDNIKTTAKNINWVEIKEAINEL